MSRSRTDVVTAFLLDVNALLLLLRRSDSVRTYPGSWAAVSGYLETKDPLLQAKRELRQETGLDPSRMTLIRKGTPLRVDDSNRENYWRVHPIRFQFPESTPSVKLNEEHTDYKWVHSDSLSRYDTVPDLLQALEATFP